MLDVEYSRSGSHMTEIQWRDPIDDLYHSYLVEGCAMMDEIIGQAANLLEEMPPDCKVYICSGDVNKLCQMELEFEEYLIADVVFVTPMDVLNGKLRGRLGTLLITDMWLLTDNVRECLYREQEVMKATLLRGDW